MRRGRATLSVIGCVFFIATLLIVGPLSLADELCRTALHPQINPAQNGRWWDTWIAYDPIKDEYHSYSQWVSDSDFTPNSFAYHNKARIRHRVSKDQNHWMDLGVIHIEHDPIKKDHLAFWSGSVIIQNGVFYLFYTRGANEFSSAAGDQRIHLATSRDGHNFKFESELLSPEQITNSTFPYTFEFTVSPDYRIIPALRDPHVFRDENHWTMLFAANIRSADGRVRHAIGTMTSPDLKHWQVGAPLDLPFSNSDSSLQVELPNIAQVADLKSREKKVLLMVSARNGSEKSLHFFFSNHTRGPWLSLPWTSHISLSPYYGFNFVKRSNRKLELVFFDEKNLQLHHNRTVIELNGQQVILKPASSR